jgi:hypothetical protein
MLLESNLHAPARQRPANVWQQSGAADLTATFNMNLQIPTPQPELVLRLPYDAGLRVFGRSWAIRAEIWAQLETGTPPLAEIARSYGVSRQYVGKLAKRVRECNPRS